MDQQEMSNEENYCFDVAGYLHIPAVLTPEVVAVLNGAVDTVGRDAGMLGWANPWCEPFRDLLIQPHLVGYLNQLIGFGFRLDTEPVLLGAKEDSELEPMLGGNEPRNPSQAYYLQNGRRYCQRVRALWALMDVDAADGGYGLVPATHKANVETPAQIADGSDDMELVRHLTLKAGDLLLVAGTVLQGIRPWKGTGALRMLRFDYAGRGAIQTVGTGPETANAPVPDWHADLNPAQRASVHVPGYADTTPPPTLVTDGEGVKVEESRRVFHPSIFIKDPDSTIDEKEFYFWDLCGYLIMRNVMDPAWLDAANAALDRFEDRIKVGEELARGSQNLAGTGRPVLDGLIHLPKPYCDPFRKMLAHSAVEHRLNWMGASGLRCAGPTAFCAVQGTSGHALHDGNEPLYPPMGYQFQNGRSYAEAVTVAWQLRDVEPGLGGFACVPGSHKAQYRKPPGVTSCDADMGLVVQPEMKAGDVLFFADGAVSHGALAWKNPLPRRGLLIKYSSRNFNRSGGEMVHPEKRWGDLVEGMSDAQLTVMRGPDRDARNLNVPRLLVEDGQIEVSYERGSALYSKEAPTGPVKKD